MKYHHKSLANGRWNTFSFFMQMANIGSEVMRFISSYRASNDSELAAQRALELLDLTIDDPKNHTKSRQKELWLLREFMVDDMFFDNIYGSTKKMWQNYFDAFTYAAALERGF